MTSALRNADTHPFLAPLRAVFTSLNCFGSVKFALDGLVCLNSGKATPKGVVADKGQERIEIRISAARMGIDFAKQVRGFVLIARKG